MIQEMGTTKYGILVESIFQPSELIAIAKQVEDMGFNHIWYPDEKFFRDCYIGLCLVAQNTHHIALGPCVTDPYSRHPIMTAAAIASLAAPYLRAARAKSGMHGCIQMPIKGGERAYPDVAGFAGVEHHRDGVDADADLPGGRSFGKSHAEKVGFPEAVGGLSGRMRPVEAGWPHSG